MKIGLALSGGGAKGLAYLGMFEVFNEKKVPISAISGSSAGALFGAMYALDFTIEEMMLTAKKVDWDDLLDFSVPKKALLKDDGLEIALRKVFGNNRFEDAKIPIFITAVDLHTGKEIIFSKGLIWKAVRASISLPGIMNPVEMNKKCLVDGGVIDPIPTKILEEKKMNKIIAVDITTNPLQTINKKSKLTKKMYDKFITQEVNHFKNYLSKRKILFNKFKFLFNPKLIARYISSQKTLEIINVLQKSNDILQNELTKEKIKNAKIDVFIQPDVSRIGFLAFDQVELGRKIGRESTEAKMREIKKLYRKRT